MKFAKDVSDINLEMVYVIAAYHDIGHHINRKNHERVSATILLEDEQLREFFSSEEMQVMKEAVEDHRASLEYEPRSIYGKIVSSADRNTVVDYALMRTYTYRLEHFPNFSLDMIIEESRKHLMEKFGEDGYASEKMYFDDLEYTKYLEELRNLISDKEKFAARYKAVISLE